MGVGVAVLWLLTTVLFQVETVDGRRLEGEITEWNEQALRLRQGDDVVSLPPASLMRMSSMSSSERESPMLASPSVALADDSLLAVDRMTLDAKVARLELVTGGVLDVPTSSLRFFRIRPPDAESNEAWDRLAAMELESDRLVVRRENAALDFLDGTVLAISPENATFEFDGQSMDVALGKLEGILFFRGASPSPEGPTFRMMLQDGGRLVASRAILAEGVEKVRLSLASGAELTVPLEAVHEVDFAAGNVRYVSDIPPTQMEIEPFLGSVAREDLLTAWLYRPRWNAAHDGGPIRLVDPESSKVETYAKGIAVHSRTRLVYRTDEPFREVRGWVGMAADIGTGVADVRILVNGEEQLSTRLDPMKAPQEIAISGDRATLLEIVVDYGDESDRGDIVHFGDIRLIKGSDSPQPAGDDTR